MNLLIVFSRESALIESVVFEGLMLITASSRNLNEAPPAFVLLRARACTHTHTRAFLHAKLRISAAVCYLCSSR